jgi:hypothetical protein
MSVMVGRKMRAAPDTTVVFEVAGPVSRTLAIAMKGEHATPLDQPPAVPTVTPSHKELTL